MTTRTLARTQTALQTRLASSSALKRTTPIKGAIKRPTPIAKQNTPIGTATVTAGALNVRQGPGTNYPRIGGLSQGATIQVYEDAGDWLKISFGSDYGYVSQKYTTFQDQATDPGTQNPEPTPEPTPEPEPEPTPEPEPGPESADSTAPAGATYTGTETTKKGSTNKEAVKTLQLYLNKYLASMGVSAMTVDSSFGNTTWKYLMYYQYSRNLCDSSGKIEVDGICGPKTWNAIRTGAPIVYDIREPIAFNKGYKLEANCTTRLSCGGAMCPNGAAQFEKMIIGAKNAGHKIATNSTFRGMTNMGTTKGVGESKSGQIELFIQKNGNTTYAAKPGYSNHQSGKAADIAGLALENDTSALFKWLKSNAATYQFKNYPAECWHWDYTGN